MSSLTFDIKNLFQERFGVQPNEFEGNFGNNTEWQFKTEQNTRTVTANSTAQGGELYTEYKGKYYFLPIYLDGQLLPHAIIKLQSRKNIVKTPLVGQRGTVKEFISMEDYSISIQGFCIGAKLTWPEDEIMLLRDIYTKNEAIELRSAVTDLFLLTSDRKVQDKVVIEGLNFDEFKSTHIVAYSMDIISDSIFDIENV